MDIRGYKELLKVIIETARQHLKEVGAKVEAGNFELFYNFTRDLSAAAKTLGVLSYERDYRCRANYWGMCEKYLFSLRVEIERLYRVVAELN